MSRKGHSWNQLLCLLIFVSIVVSLETNFNETKTESEIKKNGKGSVLYNFFLSALTKYVSLLIFNVS